MHARFLEVVKRTLTGGSKWLNGWRASWSDGFGKGNPLRAYNGPEKGYGSDALGFMATLLPIGLCAMKPDRARDATGYLE